MQIIPAIDIRNGRCVRLDQGDYNRETVFADDPAEVARQFAAAGATRIHTVDLDGAREGVVRNEAPIHAVIAAAGIPVQVGGGVRDLAIIQRFLDAGADRVAIGTAAVKDPTMLANAVARFGDRMFVGVDARDGLVATEGWLETSEIRALDLVRRLSELGVQRIFYTDITQDGMLKGPNFAAIEEMLAFVGTLGSPMAVIASGGVSSLDHVKRLASTGVEGVIIGKAFYTGALDLGDAIAAAG